MDDLILIHHDRAFLEACHKEIERKLSQIGFELNPKKTRLYSLKEGIRFLGFTFRLTDSGKVLMQIAPERVKAQKKKLFRLVAKAKKGALPRENVDMSYAAWRNHASKGNSFHLLQRMDHYYHALWKGD